MGCASSSKTKSGTDQVHDGGPILTNGQVFRKLSKNKDQLASQQQHASSSFSVNSGRPQVTRKRSLLGRTVIAQVNLRSLIRPAHSRDSRDSRDSRESPTLQPQRPHHHNHHHQQQQQQQQHVPGCQCQLVHAHGYHGHARDVHAAAQRYGHCSHTYIATAATSGVTSHAGRCQHSYQLMVYHPRPAPISGPSRNLPNTSSARDGESSSAVKQPSHAQRKSRSRSRSRTRDEQAILKEEYELMKREANLEALMSKMSKELAAEDSDQDDNISKRSESTQSSCSEDTPGTNDVISGNNDIIQEITDVNDVKLVIDSVINAAMRAVNGRVSEPLNDSDKPNYDIRHLDLGDTLADVRTKSITNELESNDNENKNSDEESTHRGKKALTATKTRIARRKYFQYMDQIHEHEDDRLKKKADNILSRLKSKGKKEHPTSKYFKVSKLPTSDNIPTDTQDNISQDGQTFTTISGAPSADERIEDNETPFRADGPSGAGYSPSGLRYAPGDAAIALGERQDWWQAGRESGWRDGWQEGYIAGLRSGCGE